MDAKDLMVGDWVYAIDDNGEKHLCRANNLEYDYINERDDFSVDFYGTDFNPELPDIAFNVEPIPLTAEILEKNGFKFDGSGQRSMMLISEPHFSEGIRYNIYVGLKKKTIEVFVAHPVEKSPNWRKSNKVYLEVCGLYVHELQHVLRLCGIEKEIQL